MPIFKNKLKLVAAAVLLALSGGTANAANTDVLRVLVGNNIQYQQTSATQTTIDNSGSGAYTFSADVQGNNFSPAPGNGPILTGPIAAGAPFTSGNYLYFNTSNNPNFNTVYGIDPNDNGYSFTSQAALEAVFPQGIYTLGNGSNISVPLNLHGDLYPATTPLVTITGGTWSNGVYLVDPNQAITITSNAFAEYNSSSGLAGHIGLSLQAPNASTQLFNIEQISNSNPNDQISYTIAANTLAAGQTYYGNVNFATVVDLQPNSLLPNSLNAAFYSLDTGFVISAVPIPAAAWLLLSAVMGLLTLNRRKAA